MAIIMAVVSGALMAIQGVWNTRVTEKLGLWFTNSIVQLVGLITSVIILLFVRDAQLDGFKEVNKFYLLAGVLGVGIVYTVVVSMAKLGPGLAVMIILITQVIVAYLIELFGLFGTEKASFMWTKLLGVVIMAGGILLFQWKRA
jgi:transporter family-2 protein